MDSRVALSRKRSFRLLELRDNKHLSLLLSNRSSGKTQRIPPTLMEIVRNKTVTLISPLIERLRVDVSVQTTPLTYKDISIDPLVCPSKLTQTERKDERILSARQVKLSEQVVNLVLEELQQLEVENPLFLELDKYHNDKKVQLEFLKKLEELPLHSLKCSADRRVCVLFGERRHETWCLHSGRLLLYEKSKSNWISLESCPTQVLFAPQNQLIAGTAIGTITVFVGEETVWTSDKMHFQSVTSLRWLSNKLVFSTALDGRLVVSSLQPLGLEPIKSAVLNVSDLPRSMRKSNASSTKVSAVTSTLGGYQLYIARAILIVDPDSLKATPIGYDPDGIDLLEWVDDKFLSLSSIDNQIKLLDRTGHTLEWLNCRTSSNQCSRQGSLFIFLDQEKIVGYDMNLNKQVLLETMPFLAVDLTSDGTLVAIDTDMNLVWYQLSSQR